jgi:hypothetical protein
VFRKKPKKPSPDTLTIDSKDSPLSLRLIKGVLVVVEDLPTKVEKTGLTSDQIQTYVEAKCKRAGLKVLSTEESLNMAGYPILAVNIDLKKIQGNGHYLYAIHLGLHQNVHLERDPQIMIIGATTWTTSSYGLGKEVRSMRVRIKNHVNEFINAYSAANSRTDISPQRLSGPEKK